jgi:hypothetical protein
MKSGELLQVEVEVLGGAVNKLRRITIEAARSRVVK